MSQQVISDQDFLNDLIEDEEVAKILRVKQKSIPVMRCRGKIPVETYRRGRTTLTSRRGLTEYLRSGKLLT